jgi:hypothetical protein
LDIPRSDIGREEGGEVSLGDVGVRGRNPFNTVRGVDVDMMRGGIQRRWEDRESTVSRDKYVL